MSLSEPQLMNKFVQAGAGAGKTTNLTQEVIAFALSFREKHQVWPRVVLTTFTRKATQELKERLMVYALKEKPEAIDFVHSRSFLSITTMHGLLYQFLSQKGQSLGLSGSFQMVDASQADVWRKQILRDLVHQSFDFDELKDMGIKKLFEALKSLEPFLSEPGAKTYDEAKFENQSRLCREMLAQSVEEALKRAQSQDLHTDWETYLSFAKGALELLSSDLPWSEARHQLEKHSGLAPKKPRRTKNKPGPDDETLKIFKNIEEQIKSWCTEEQFNPELWPHFSRRLQALERLGQVYGARLRAKKLEEARLEADDLELLSLQLIKDFPETAKDYSQQIDAWFIDEFQDTSPRQIQILTPLLGESSRYIVGDPQQSIYLFRGARSEVFHDMKSRHQQKGGTLGSLQKSYRSQSQLVAFFNSFFTDLGPQFTPMQAHHLDNDKVARVAITHHNERADEFAYLTQELNRLLNKGVSPKEIAILCRARVDVDWLQSCLFQIGFPVLSHNSSEFYKRREIIDAMALLKVLIHPWDNKNLVTLLRSPWLKVSDEDLVKLVSQRPKHYWPVIRDHYLSENHEPLKTLHRCMQALPQWGLAFAFRTCLQELGFFDYSQAVDSTGRREANLWKLVHSVEKHSREPGARLLQLLKKGAWVQALEDVGDDGDASSPMEPDKINLMTIHSSKGLQFEHVFLPFLQKKENRTHYTDLAWRPETKLWSYRLQVPDDTSFKGGFPEWSFLKDLKHREEEESLRVLYVAMTRAKHNLYLSWHNKAGTDSWAGKIDSYCDRYSLEDGKLFCKTSPPLESPARFSTKEQKVELREPYQKDLNLVPLPEKTGETLVSLDVFLDTQRRRWRGVVLHRLFESLNNHSPQKVLELGQAWLPDDQESLAKALTYLMQLEEPPFAEILKQGCVEWGYQFEQEGHIEEGRIDLWAQLSQELWVVDYKTGNEKNFESAFVQLENYAHVLKSYTGWQGAIRLCALYPFSEKCYVRKFN